jgi:hypothetical protein
MIWSRYSFASGVPLFFLWNVWFRTFRYANAQLPAALLLPLWFGALKKHPRKDNMMLDVWNRISGMFKDVSFSPFKLFRICNANLVFTWNNIFQMRNNIFTLILKLYDKSLAICRNSTSPWVAVQMVLRNSFRRGVEQLPEDSWTKTFDEQDKKHLVQQISIAYGMLDVKTMPRHGFMRGSDAAACSKHRGSSVKGKEQACSD